MRITESHEIVAKTIVTVALLGVTSFCQADYLTEVIDYLKHIKTCMDTVVALDFENQDISQPARKGSVMLSKRLDDLQRFNTATFMTWKDRKGLTTAEVMDLEGIGWKKAARLNCALVKIPIKPFPRLSEQPVFEGVDETIRELHWEPVKMIAPRVNHPDDFVKFVTNVEICSSNKGEISKKDVYRRDELWCGRVAISYFSSRGVRGRITECEVNEGNPFWLDVPSVLRPKLNCESAFCYSVGAVELDNGYVGDWSGWCGKWVLIAYYAEWCAPCYEEIALLNELYKEQNEYNVVVLGVNYDGKQGAELHWVKRKMEIDFPSLLSDPSSRWNRSKPKAIPATYVVNPQGNIRKVLIGIQDKETLLKLLSTRKTPT